MHHMGMSNSHLREANGVFTRHICVTRTDPHLGFQSFGDAPCTINGGFTLHNRVHPPSWVQGSFHNAPQFELCAESELCCERRYGRAEKSEEKRVDDIRDRS